MKDRIDQQMRQVLCEQVSQSDNPRGEELITFIQEQAPFARIREMYYESQDRQAQYKAYFKGKLKVYGVNSPDELDDEMKKKFFNEVNDGWKAKDEGASY
jgi:hypothetical protein